jgi:hypothetical protein
VLEVATIFVQTGLHPARHILEIPCFLIANNKHSLLQSIPIHFPTILCELTHYTNTHKPQPYCVGTFSQMTERLAEWRVRQETGWLAGGPLLRVATTRRTTDTFLFISHTTNVLLFKFLCNIFIGVRIIKEMLDSVASGTPCSKPMPYHNISLIVNSNDPTQNGSLKHSATSLVCRKPITEGYNP